MAISNDADVAETFNNVFVNVAEDIKINDILDPLQNKTTQFKENWRAQHNI